MKSTEIDTITFLSGFFDEPHDQIIVKRDGFISLRGFIKEGEDLPTHTATEQSELFVRVVAAIDDAWFTQGSMFKDDQAILEAQQHALGHCYYLDEAQPRDVVSVLFQSQAQGYYGFVSVPCDQPIDAAIVQSGQTRFLLESLKIVFPWYKEQVDPKPVEAPSPWWRFW